MIPANILQNKRWAAFLNRLPFLTLLMVIFLGALHTWTASRNYSMNADGISYLDIGDAYMRGDWDVAINSVWSPLYSWILGLVLYGFQPAMAWEFTVVHSVNFVIFLLALACFSYFWRQFLVEPENQRESIVDQTLVRLPVWAWYTLGYILFAWISLNLIKIWAVTPDMLMTAFVYLAAGLIVQLRQGVTHWKTFISLGLVLGLGYLSKAIMFPLAFVFMGAAFVAMPNKRTALWSLFISLITFILVSGPFIFLISEAKGTFTFGDASKITYVRHVNGLPYPHWQGGTPQFGQPLHPSRKVFTDPAIYEFATPIGGTYPISYDPYYWYEGAKAQFDLGQQIKLLLASALFYFDLFFHQQGGWLAVVLILYALRLGLSPSFSISAILPKGALTLVALVGFGMYGLILVAGRYIGVFVVLFWADILANIRLPDSGLNRLLLSFASLCLMLFLGLNIIAFNLEGVATLNHQANLQAFKQEQAPPPSWPGEVAQTLHQLGIQPGDKVAIIGYGFTSFWARLAQVQIIAEMSGLEADPFWLGTPTKQAEVIRAFSKIGAQAIVAEDVPAYASLPSWHQVGNSNYYIYLTE